VSPDVNILIAFAGGLLSFFSPCIVPLVPSYLSYVGGASLDELRETTVVKHRVLLRTVFFVVGFSTVFMVLGALFSGSALLFTDAGILINLVAGAIVTLLGIHMIMPFTRFLQVEHRVRLPGKPHSYGGSMLVGMAFGAGWTPCIGPVLAGILFLAGSSAEPARGIAYLGAYSIGLGIPFIGAAAFFEPVLRRLQGLRRHFGKLKLVSGLFLITIGLLIAFGRFQYLNIVLMRAGVALGDWHTANPLASRIGLSAAAVLIAALPLALRLLKRDRNRQLPQPGTGRLIWTGLWVTIAALQLTGLIELAELLQSYLMFQGV